MDGYIIFSLSVNQVMDTWTVAALGLVCILLLRTVTHKSFTLESVVGRVTAPKDVRLANRLTLRKQDYPGLLYVISRPSSPERMDMLFEVAKGD